MTSNSSAYLDTSIIDGSDIQITIQNDDFRIGSNNSISNIICPVCHQYDLKDDVFVIPVCQHTFCLNCLRNYIELKIEAFDILNIRCLQEGCQQVLTLDSIKEIISESKYKKYQELLSKKLSYKAGSIRLCPSPGCIRQINLDWRSNPIRCACGMKVCKDCWDIPHPGQSCLQSLDQEFSIYAQNNDIKLCVACKTAVSRVEGCLHMTCCVCDYEWCWTCGREYTFDHTCPGEWSPFETRSHVNTLLAKSKATILKLKRVTLNFLNIFCFFVFYLRRMCVISLDYQQSNIRGYIKKITAVIICLLLGIVFFKLTLILFLLYAGILLFKKIAQKMSANYTNSLLPTLRPQVETKRWMTGNLSSFMYTAISRPRISEPILKKTEDNDAVSFRKLANENQLHRYPLAMIKSKASKFHNLKQVKNV